MKLFQTMAVATAMLGANANLGYCDFQTGSRLLEMCSADESGNQSYCLGYIAAMADTFSCDSPLMGFSWKPSSRITNGQLVKVVTKWMNDHPENLHYSASSLVANALQDAFPCQ